MKMIEATYEPVRRNPITGFFQYMPWQLFITLDMPDDSSFEEFGNKLSKWRKNLYNSARSKVMYTGVYLYGPNRHAHILALSRQNRLKNTLADIDEDQLKQLERLWYGLAQRPAKVLHADCPEAISEYMTCHRNIASHPWEAIDTVGEKLFDGFSLVPKAA